MSSPSQLRAYAAQYGLIVGAVWSVSFMLSIMGVGTPMLTNVGLLLGLLSLPIAVMLLRQFSRTVQPLTPLSAWRLAWATYCGAALVCTLMQYVYFAYIDQGRFLVSYTELLAQPEAQEMLERMLPGQDVGAFVDNALATFAAITPSQFAMNFLFINLILATVMALPTALAGWRGNR